MFNALDAEKIENFSPADVETEAKIVVEFHSENDPGDACPKGVGWIILYPLTPFTVLRKTLYL